MKNVILFIAVALVSLTSFSQDYYAKANVDDGKWSTASISVFDGKDSHIEMQGDVFPNGFFVFDKVTMVTTEELYGTGCMELGTYGVDGILIRIEGLEHYDKVVPCMVFTFDDKVYRMNLYHEDGAWVDMAKGEFILNL